MVARRGLWLNRRRFLGMAAAGLATVACARKTSRSVGSFPKSSAAPDPVNTVLAVPASPAPSAAVRIQPVQGAANPTLPMWPTSLRTKRLCFWVAASPIIAERASRTFSATRPQTFWRAWTRSWSTRVAQQSGDRGLQIIYEIVARNLLDTLLAVYGSKAVVLALDAGHGGLAGVYFEPGLKWQRVAAYSGGCGRRRIDGVRSPLCQHYDPADLQ